MKFTKEDYFGILYFLSKVSLFRFRIRIQKLALIAKIEFNYPFSFNYKSYYYGPYSEELTILINNLCRRGLVEENIEEITRNSEVIRTFNYQLTQKGHQKLIRLKSLNEYKGLAEKINKMWDGYKQKTIKELVDYAKKISGMESINT